MTTGRPQPLVPKLRFPEFRNAGDWHFQPLRDIAELISEKVGTGKCVPMSVTTGVGLLSQEEKFGRIIAGNSYKNYTRLQTNDFAYNKSATKEFPQGYIARYSGAKDAAVPNSIFTCFRPQSTSVIPEYLDYLLHGNHHGRWLRKYITVGARAHGALSVADDALMSLPVPLPPIQVMHSEQQKIADCLGSLDDLITAEGQKLEALRQHKKGLMQQLFPQSGGIMPKLRFPEFRDWGEWETRKLGDVISRGKEKFDPQKNRDTPQLIELENIESRTGRILGISEIEKQKSLKSRFRAGDVLFGKLRPYLQKFARPNFQGVCTTEIWVLRGKIVSSAFLFYLVQTERFIQLANVSSGSRMPRAEWKFLAGADFQIPHPDEQQKIADSLGILDDLITAECQKVETLRQHKQGLMQQLFPYLGTE